MLFPRIRCVTVFCLKMKWIHMKLSLNIIRFFCMDPLLNKWGLTSSNIHQNYINNVSARWFWNSQEVIHQLLLRNLGKEKLVNYLRKGLNPSVFLDCVAGFAPERRLTLPWNICHVSKKQLTLFLNGGHIRFETLRSPGSYRSSRPSTLIVVKG